MYSHTFGTHHLNNNFCSIKQNNGPDWPARIRHLMTLAPLSYSLVIMMKDKIYGVRDPYGNRPLCIGKIVPINLGRCKNELNACQRCRAQNENQFNFQIHLKPLRLRGG